MEFALDVHICDQRRSYKATFASADQVLAFAKARRSTHVVTPLDPEAFPWTAELEEYFYPSCHHGMSLWLCADPVNHYPADNQY